MGILKEPAALVKGLKLEPGFSVCEFGNQFVSFTDPPSSAEAFYRRIGCGRYVSIDGNGKGTITADLNQSLSSYRLGTFDLVTDFGTGEHVFDQAQVWRSMHDLTTPGGYLAFDRPSQGYAQHCFYLVTDSLITDVAAANRYEIVRVEKKETPRGWLVRGIFQRPVKVWPFRVPQQGRYQASLVIPEARF